MRTQRLRFTSRIQNTGKSAMDALVSLSQAMTIEEEEPVHILVGDK